jgi:hypothetical protein
MNPMPPLPGDTSMTEESQVHNDSAASSATETTVGVRENTLATERRKMKLIEKYSVGQTSTEYNKSTMLSLNNAVRKVLIPRMKFVSERKQFGQFDQPDFSNTNCWVHRVFDQLGTLKHADDCVKAEIWMNYRNKIKEQFSVHRANVTNRLKMVFQKGNCFDLYIYPLFQCVI